VVRPAGQEVGSATNSRLSPVVCSLVADFPASAVAEEHRCRPAEVPDSQGVADLLGPRLANWRQGQASGLVSGHRKPVAHRQGHRVPLGLLPQWLAVAPCRCRLAAVGSGSPPERAACPQQVLPRRGLGKLDVPPTPPCGSGCGRTLLQPHQRCLSDLVMVGMARSLHAWRWQALGSGKNPLGLMLERGHVRATVRSRDNTDLAR